ncbi:hypothetical protein KIN20_029314 [Parelaphostrongylus tenuis]|uniref:Uncharacterized protein n=1 Tax=Parelaphostrongylus tenuis TaxID=148309 RepID=A0AAD5R286_PARTN|nr:hypothetical protein KIN20_029314 [Parelaphostrongylus tenuis]
MCSINFRPLERPYRLVSGSGDNTVPYLKFHRSSSNKKNPLSSQYRPTASLQLNGRPLPNGRHVKSSASGHLAHTLANKQAAQMVHDSREQWYCRASRSLDRKWSKWRGRSTPAPTSTGSSIAGHHPNGRLTSPGPPHLISLSIHHCSLCTVSLSCN